MRIKLITSIFTIVIFNLFFISKSFAMQCGIDTPSACGDMCASTEDCNGRQICKAYCGVGLICISCNSGGGGYTGGGTTYSSSGGTTYSSGGGSYSQPTPTPRPKKPADLKPTVFYLKDSSGDKTYNFNPNQNIFWYAKIKNYGELAPYSSSTSYFHSNLYQDQSTAFTKAITTDYSDPNITQKSSDLGPGDEFTYDSRPSGAGTSKFMTTDGQDISTHKSFSRPANNGDPLIARIFVDPKNRFAEYNNNNYSNNQATFRYVIGNPDLTIPSFQLADIDGNVHTAFDVNARIYPKVTIANTGTAQAISRDPNDLNTYGWFYNDRPSAVTVGTSGSSDTGVSLKTGEFGTGSSYNYYCKPGSGSKCDRYNNDQYWHKSTKGTYTARFFMNYDDNVVDTNMSNNQVTTAYSVGYTIQGRIYADMNKSGGYTTGVDYPLSGVKVTFTGPGDSGTATTNSSGQYTSPALEPGTYTVTTNVSSDYNSLSTYPLSSIFTSRVDLAGQDIRYFPKYTIAGKVFVDQNSNNIADAGENNYAASPVITLSNLPGNAPTPIVTNNNDGTYSIAGLINGQYTVRYTGLPVGYVINNPRNGPPPSYDAVVGIGGTNCTAAPNAPDATCSSGSMINLNYAIKGGEPWWQTYGLDVRFDSGINNPIPPAPNATCQGPYSSVVGSSTTPGVIFSGSVNPYFWRGDSSSTGWVVGNSSYNERFSTNLLKTSFGYFQSILSQSSITPTNLSGACPQLNNCTLPANLAHGVYIANGNLVLNSYTVSANTNYVILVNGNLTLQGTTMTVPTGSTITFIASGDIHVASNVGVATPACPAPAAGSGNIQGFFSTDKNFIIDSAANCPNSVSDKQLSIEGSVVVNAAQNGGSFNNQRDLCTNNINFPSVSIKERPDFIMYAPDLLRGSNYVFQEVAP